MSSAGDVVIQIVKLCVNNCCRPQEKSGPYRVQCLTNVQRCPLLLGAFQSKELAERDGRKVG